MTAFTTDPLTAVPMRIGWDVPIEMDDGNVARANVFLPPEEGRYPVVMAMTSYAKDLPFIQGFKGAYDNAVEAAPEVAERTSGRYISFEAPDPEKWVPHGYAVVVMDSRGVGRSPGVVDSYSLRESQDYYTAIEWAAAQPWSTGKVGLLGMSYLGKTMWGVANLKPPHLTAIVPWEAADDSLRVTGYHGGIPSSFYEKWYESQVKSVQNGLGSRGFRNVFTGNLISGDEDMTDEELEANAGPTDIYKNLMQHPLDDEYYKGRRAEWDKIDIPILSVSSWGSVGLHLRANLEAFQHAAAKEKWLWIREAAGTFAGLYGDEGLALQRRFLDYTLKGEGDFAETQPKAVLHIRSVDDTTIEKRAEEEWPLARTEWRKLYFDLDSSALSHDTPAANQSATYRAYHDGITLLSNPVPEDTEITGPMACKFWASSSTADADFFLVVRIFDADGNEKFFHGMADPKIPLTYGWLRASQRKLDPAKSLPYRPYLSHDTVQPLWPGQIYELDVEVWPACVLLPKGYRIGLSILGKDFDHGDPFWWEKAGVELRGSSMWVHDDPRYRPAEIFDNEVTVHSGPDHPSYFLLPVVPRA